MSSAKCPEKSSDFPLDNEPLNVTFKGTLFPSELMGTFAFSEKFCPKSHFLQEFQALPRKKG